MFGPCTNSTAGILLACMIFWGAAQASVRAQSETCINYQGQLKEGGIPLAGSGDFRFSLHDTAMGGGPLVAPLQVDDVLIAQGRFTTDIDFGADVFDGNARFLEIAVRVPHDPTDTLPFTTLSPRQAITSTPMALQTRGIHVTDARKVGIGTSNPATLLSLQGGGLQVFDDANEGITLATDAFSITTATNEDPIYQYNFGNDRHDFLTDGSLRMVLDHTGRVGIGTGTPDNILHVMKGSAGLLTGHPNALLVIENSTNAYINFLTPDINERGLLFGSPTAGITSGGIIYNAATTPEGLQFRTGGNVNRMVIDANGGVGLGTNAPATDLHVFENSGVSRIRVESADSQAGISFLSDSTVENVIYSPDGTDDLRFFVNSADRLSITSAGNVGIGTTAPDTKLEVRDGQARIKINSTTSPTTGSILELSNRTLGHTTTGAVNFIDAVDFIQGQMKYVDNGLSFSTAGALQMRLDPAGNLGIGTSNPTAKLHVIAPAGDSSVVLPSASISVVEIADEPGLASDQRIDILEVLDQFDDNAPTLLASRTITVPTDGFVIASASCVLTVGAFGVGGSRAHLTINKTTAPTADAVEGSTKMPGALDSQTLSFHGVFAVSAGANAFTLTGRTGGPNTCNAQTRRLTLMFMPTTYGTTDVED